MSNNAQPQQPSPGIDLVAGAFFLAWAGVGWVAYFGNDALRRSLFASADPGPALLPLITLWILTSGGVIIVIKGVYRLLTKKSGEGVERLPHPREHIAPISFVVSVLIAVFLMRRIGFPIAGFSLSAIWLYVLSSNLRFSPRNALLAVIFGATMTFVVYYIFVKLLLVPLPR